jgi:hypothetical protein
MRHSQLSNSLNAMLMPRAKLTAHALKLKLLQKLTQRNLRFALIEKGLPRAALFLFADSFY